MSLVVDGEIVGTIDVNAEYGDNLEQIAATAMLAIENGEFLVEDNFFTYDEVKEYMA